jgi:hypothetical protein
LVFVSIKPSTVESTGGQVPIRSPLIEGSGASELGTYLLGLLLAAALLEGRFERSEVPIVDKALSEM